MPYVDTRSMRTLIDAFAPGVAALPEGLRSLRVSPSQFVRPGETVHAQFTFRNLGGGTATGFRVRFRLPEGLTYLVGTARIDETPLDEQGGLTTLLQGSGADIGEIPPGGERRVSLDYTVAPTIENGTSISLQAAVASFEVPVIGSNVARLVVRSRPLLHNPKTVLSMAPLREAVPGEELQVRALVHNAGESSAHDVIVMLPLPPNTSYVEGSARVDGREPGKTQGTEPFGLSRPKIVAPNLTAGATLEVAYRARIETILEDETPIVLRGVVCSQETTEFNLDPVTLKVPSAPSFQNDETTFALDCDDEVVPGQHIRAVVRLRNTGTARAHNVRIKISLPNALQFCPGSRTIDGVPVGGDKETGSFAIGELEPLRTIECALAGVVRSPAEDGTKLALSARIEWVKGTRAFSHAIVIRSIPAFPRNFNYIQRESAPRLSPGDSATFTIALRNVGTDVAEDARLQLEVDRGLEHLQAFEDDKEIALGEGLTIHLDTLVPAAGRTLRIESRLADVLEDDSHLRLHAALHTERLAPVDLGAAGYLVTSRPRFSTAKSGLAVEGTNVVRLNSVTPCRLTLCNEGTDRARDVRVRLQLPDDILLDRVDLAGRDDEYVVLGDIAARQTREVTLFLRPVGPVRHGESIEIPARVTGYNVVPLSLEPLVLTTRAEATFIEGATLTAIPMEVVDTGAPIIYTLWLRNAGDGAAKRLSIRFDAPTNATYAPGSTSVNDVTLLDFAGTSPLLTPTGLSLGDVGVGAEIVIRMRVIVNAPLPEGTVVDARAFVAWDEQPEMTVRAQPVRVRSMSALPVANPILPFTVLDAAAAPAELLALGNGHAKQLSSSPEDVQVLPAPDVAQLPPVTAVLDEPIFVSLYLGDDRLAWTVRYLEEGHFNGLMQHLMVLRALFPDDASGADASTRGKLRAHRERFGESIDRLFVRLRQSNNEIATKDLETPELREGLADVVASLSRLPRPAPYEATGLRLVGAVHVDELEAAATSLQQAPLNTSAPWSTMALLLGTSLERGGKVIAEVGGFREALRAQLSEMRDVAPAEFARAAQSSAISRQLDAERDKLLRMLSAELPALR
jgi:uncharacterized repeat protein (TIGR01451 family)